MQETSALSALPVHNVLSGHSVFFVLPVCALPPQSAKTTLSILPLLNSGIDVYEQVLGQASKVEVRANDGGEARTYNYPGFRRILLYSYTPTVTVDGFVQTFGPTVYSLEFRLSPKKVHTAAEALRLVGVDGGALAYVKQPEYGVSSGYFKMFGGADAGMRPGAWCARWIYSQNDGNFEQALFLDAVQGAVVHQDAGAPALICAPNAPANAKRVTSARMRLALPPGLPSYLPFAQACPAFAGRKVQDAYDCPYPFTKSEAEIQRLIDNIIIALREPDALMPSYRHRLLPRIAAMIGCKVDRVLATYYNGVPT